MAKTVDLYFPVALLRAKGWISFLRPINNMHVDFLFVMIPFGGHLMSRQLWYFRILNQHKFHFFFFGGSFLYVHRCIGSMTLCTWFSSSLALGRIARADLMLCISSCEVFSETILTFKLWGLSGCCYRASCLLVTWHSLYNVFVLSFNYLCGDTRRRRCDYRVFHYKWNPFFQKCVIRTRISVFNNVFVYLRLWTDVIYALNNWLPNLNCIKLLVKFHSKTFQKVSKSLLCHMPLVYFVLRWICH